MLSVLKGLLSLANFIASYLKDKQLFDAGSAISEKKRLEDAFERVRKADLAVRNLDIKRMREHNRYKRG